MSAVAQPQMSVDEFLAWAEGREGRWELHDGRVVSMSPERVSHTEAKGEAYATLRAAIRKAGAPCRALPDGATIRISARTAFEPDALVYCGPRLAHEALECPNPIVVVEVLSPGTAANDHGRKLEGYFSVPSVVHYRIVDAEARRAIHHRRGNGDVIETRILGEGPLRLDPPGLEFDVQDLFPSP